ncbi:hypothetical protein [Streptomyces sp. NPDC002537]
MSRHKARRWRLPRWTLYAAEYGMGALVACALVASVAAVVWLAVHGAPGRY